MMTSQSKYGIWLFRGMKGRFRPTNPEKYKGNPNNIFYRSSWELSMMNWLDKTDSVNWWQSEEKCLWYYDPITEKKRRYFPDFIINYKNKSGVTITEVIEVKPQYQVDGPPKNPKRKTKAWVNQVKTFVTNQAKWKATVEICENNGWNFRLLTEKNIKSWDK